MSAKGDRRRIFTGNANDITAAVLAELGFSNTCIRRKTGDEHFSDGMIGYRLKYLGMTQGRGNNVRQRYRDGLTPQSTFVIKAAWETVERHVALLVSKANAGEEQQAQKVARKRKARGA